MCGAVGPEDLVAPGVSVKRCHPGHIRTSQAGSGRSFPHAWAVRVRAPWSVAVLVRQVYNKRGRENRTGVWQRSLQTETYRGPDAG